MGDFSVQGEAAQEVWDRTGVRTSVRMGLRWVGGAYRQVWMTWAGGVGGDPNSCLGPRISDRILHELLIEKL